MKRVISMLILVSAFTISANSATPGTVTIITSRGSIKGEQSHLTYSSKPVIGKVGCGRFVMKWFYPKPVWSGHYFKEFNFTSRSSGRLIETPISLPRDGGICQMRIDHYWLKSEVRIPDVGQFSLSFSYYNPVAYSRHHYRGAENTFTSKNEAVNCRNLSGNSASCIIDLQRIDRLNENAWVDIDLATSDFRKLINEGITIYLSYR